MRFRSDRELQLGLTVLMGFQILTALVAIALLGRMSPAIERILVDNVSSIRAVESMLAALARAQRSERPLDARRDFENALAQTKRNVTEADEAEGLRQIELNMSAAFAGDPGAHERTILALQRLADANHAAMRDTDEEARRLSVAAAWAVAFLAVAAVLGSLLVQHRLRRILVVPFGELIEALSEFRSGNRYRRCVSARTTPELAPVLETLNELLDRVVDSKQPAAAGVSADRSLLLHLLDSRDAATVAVSARGEVLVANRAGLSRLAGAEGAALRDAMRRASTAAPDAPPPGYTPIAGGSWLVTLDDVTDSPPDSAPAT